MCITHCSVKYNTNWKVLLYFYSAVMMQWGLFICIPLQLHQTIAQLNIYVPAVHICFNVHIHTYVQSYRLLYLNSWFNYWAICVHVCICRFCKIVIHLYVLAILSSLVIAICILFTKITLAHIKAIQLSYTPVICT